MSDKPQNPTPKNLTSPTIPKPCICRRREFPMRAGLPQREPEILKRWNEIGLYDRLRETAAGRAKFVLA